MYCARQLYIDMAAQSNYPRSLTVRILRLIAAPNITLTDNNDNLLVECPVINEPHLNVLYEC